MSLTPDELRLPVREQEERPRSIISRYLSLLEAQRALSEGELEKMLRGRWQVNEIQELEAGLRRAVDLEVSSLKRWSRGS